MRVNTSPYLLGFLWACTLALPTFGQPANDNYTNRTILSGTDISFSGTLAGATRETGHGENTPPHVSGTQTVWWQWTAATSGTVILEVQTLATNLVDDAVTVYSLQDIATGLTLGTAYPSAVLPAYSLRFQAVAGTNYQIQLAGSDSASFNFRLIATNTPCIVQQPQPVTVTSNDSAVFAVVATGTPSLGFQWQRNGTNLANATFPVLGLYHVTTNEAGNYQVVITNAFGSITSQPANLTVTESDTAALLAATTPGSSAFNFSILGEIGRRYRVQSATALTNWTSETSFAGPFIDHFFPPPPNLRSVVTDFTGADTYSIPMTNSQKFVRVTAFHAINEECNNNLKMMRFAEALWAYDSGQYSDGSVTFSDIAPYLKTDINGFPASCPDGGTYSLTTVGANPGCSLHPFEER